MKISDISAWQGNIDWNKARKELDFVIFRASVGNLKDTRYVEYANNCGVPFGVYHFFKCGTVLSAELETEFFYKCATQEGLNPLFFVADIEYSTQTKYNTKEICETILKTLKNLGAKKIGLYIGQEKYAYVKDIINNFDFIWIPRYGKNDGTPNSQYKPIYPCDLWQYTDKGLLAGVAEKVDLNILNGNKTLEWFTGKISSMVTVKINNTLRNGSKGKEVKELQKFLNKLGYNCGIADGIFGTITTNAVKNFQKMNNLTIDGIFGKKSLAMLKKILAENDAK